ncbi:MAG: hypothetical protein WCV81_02350 [Microgenomates group bacterium]|jgi:hypothetical protein
MTKEMDRSEMAEYCANNSEAPLIHIGNKMFGWRSFFLDSVEQRRLIILEANLPDNGSQNIKEFKYISKITGMNIDEIECFQRRSNVLIVVPIVYI